MINSHSKPQDWKIAKVEDIFSFIKSYSFSRSKLVLDPEDNPIYNIHYGDIHATYKTNNVSVKKNSIPIISSKVKTNHISEYLKSGDLVMADASEDYEGIGKIIEIVDIENEKVTAGLHTFALRDKDNFTATKFRPYIFDHPSVKKRLKQLATGTSVLGVTKSNFSTLQVILPPINEQRKIAIILSTWDDSIETVDDLIAKKTSFFSSVSFELLHKTKNRVKTKLKNVSLFQNGKAHEKLVDENGGYTLVNSKFISSDGQVYKKVRENLLPLKIGDVAIVMSDVPNGKAIARCFYVSKNNIYALNQRIGLIRAKKDKVLPKYLYYLLNRNNYFLRFDNGVGQTNLRKSQVIDCPVYLPTLDEQEKISEILTDIETEINLLIAKKNLLIKQKKGLMQRLLTGKVRVS